MSVGFVVVVCSSRARNQAIEGFLIERRGEWRRLAQARHVRYDDSVVLGQGRDDRSPIDSAHLDAAVKEYDGQAVAGLE